jgi:hypothetical protein
MRKKKLYSDTATLLGMFDLHINARMSYPLIYQQMWVTVILLWNLVTPLVRAMNIISSFFKLDRQIASV